MAMQNRFKGSERCVCVTLLAFKKQLTISVNDDDDDDHDNDYHCCCCCLSLWWWWLFKVPPASCEW
jgi:hypothetical protein